MLPLVALYLVVTLVGGFLSGGLLLGGQQFLVTRTYAEQSDAARWQVPATLEIGEERSRLIARPALLATLAFLRACLRCRVVHGFTARPGARRGDHCASRRLDRGAEEHAGRVPRGDGRRSDLRELDVQRTRDGQIAVLHDGDLMRMARDPRKLGELTATELAAIDVGRPYDAAFAGEPAPPLEEVIDLVRGRMRINVELKYNVPDPGLAPAVIDLLRRKDFLDQVVITSLDPAALRQVESIEPQLQTGHIVTAAVGDVVARRPTS